jgi:hypothetical protein
MRLGDGHSLSGTADSTQSFLNYGIRQRSGVFPDAIAGLATILGEKSLTLKPNLCPLELAEISGSIEVDDSLPN